MITRLAGVCDRTVNFATATSLEEMMGQLRQMRIGIGAVERLQRLTGAGVKSSSMRRWKLVVERVPDEGMRESKAAVGSRYLAHHPRRNGLVHHLLEHLAGQPTDLLQWLDTELPAEHRRETEGTRALL